MLLNLGLIWVPITSKYETILFRPWPLCYLLQLLNISTLLSLWNILGRNVREYFVLHEFWGFQLEESLEVYLGSLTGIVYKQLNANKCNSSTSEICLCFHMHYPQRNNFLPGSQFTHYKLNNLINICSMSFLIW